MTKSYPADSRHGQSKVEKRYSTIDMLPFMSQNPAPTKMWSPALHTSFKSVEIDPKVDAAWITEHCAKVLSHAKEAFGYNYNSVTRAIKMTGIVPNLRTHALHTDS